MLTTWTTRSLALCIAVVVWALALAPGASPNTAGTAWAWPADGPVLRGFTLGDNPYAGGQHRGIDVALGGASSVRAPASGEVTFAGQVPTHGLTVTVATADGHRASLTHLGPLLVKRGVRVDAGTPVAESGSSGTPEHDVLYVHLGVRVGETETYVDPLSLLPARGSAAPPPPPAPAPSPAPGPAPAPDPPQVSSEPAQSEPPAQQSPEEPAPTAASPVTAASATAASDTAASPTAGAPAQPVAGEPVDAATGAAVADRSSRKGRSKPSASGGEPRGMPRDSTRVSKPVQLDHESRAPKPPSRLRAGAPPAPPLARRVGRLGVTVGGPGAASAREQRVRPAGSVHSHALGRDVEAADEAGLRTTRELEQAPTSHSPLARFTVALAVRRAAGWALSWHMWVALILVGATALASAARRKRLHIIDRREPNGTTAEDPRGSGVAVRVGTTPHRPCRGLRGSVGHVCAVPPAARKRRPHGQRDGRARDAGHGRGRRRRRVAA